MSDQGHIDLVFRWLLHSGLRVPAPSPHAGAVSRGYDLAQRKHQYLYLEITGYMLSWLLAAYRHTGDETLRPLAHETLDFLLARQVPAGSCPFAGAFPHHVDRESGLSHPLYYSFDAAMILQGLLDYYQESHDPRVLDAARRTGDWLVHHMQQEDGSFLAVVADGIDVSREQQDPIFGAGGCLHAKHAIGLLKLWQATGEIAYRESARAVCDWVIAQQNRHGAIRASAQTNQTVSHTHCYAVEGLLYAYAAMEHAPYLLAAQKAAAWLRRMQGSDGAIYIAYNRSLRELKSRVVELAFPRKVGDASSQAVRIWTILNAIVPDPGFLDSAQRAGLFLKSVQNMEVDPSTRGGIAYWPGHPILFAWVGMFAWQALQFLETRGQSDFRQKAPQDLF
jgi:hypothetical protein